MFDGWKIVMETVFTRWQNLAKCTSHARQNSCLQFCRPASYIYVWPDSQWHLFCKVSSNTLGDMTSGWHMIDGCCFRKALQWRMDLYIAYCVNMKQKLTIFTLLVHTHGLTVHVIPKDKCFFFMFYQNNLPWLSYISIFAYIPHVSKIGCWHSCWFQTKYRVLSLITKLELN